MRVSSGVGLKDKSSTPAAMVWGTVTVKVRAVAKTRWKG
jgi:hypothetical protein